MKLTTLALIAATLAMPAAAHEPLVSPYPTLEGEFKGGYFRPTGVDGPGLPDTSFVYEYVAVNSDKFDVEDIEDPVVRYLTQTQMEEFAGAGMGDVVALYEEGYMYLNENINFDTVEDLSILFHELIHHIQWDNGWNEQLHYQVCPFHLEREAYALQIDWLKDNGGSEEWIYAMQISGYAAGGLICYPDRPFG